MPMGRYFRKVLGKYENKNNIEDENETRV